MKVAGTVAPHMISNQFERYCETLKYELWDEGKVALRIIEVCQILDLILDGNYDRDRAKDSTLQNQAKVIIEVENQN